MVRIGLRLGEALLWGERSLPRFPIDRPEAASKRSPSYHFEELVAEMTACFLCCDLQITAQVGEESAAYLASWLSVMRQDKQMIFRAVLKAQAAADYLHTLQATDVAA